MHYNGIMFQSSTILYFKRRHIFKERVFNQEIASLHRDLALPQ